MTLFGKHLFEGIKILDSKLSVYAIECVFPRFALNAPADEKRGASWLNCCNEVEIYESEIICASNSNFDIL